MSFATATTELLAQLDALTGIKRYADRRVETLAKVGGGDLDGAYLLKSDAVKPWPEAARSARLMLATMRLEVCTLLHGDELVQLGTVSTRAKAIFDALQYTSLTSGCVVNAQAGETNRIGKDRRIVWTWTFDLRYVEA